ncbi:MAG: DUF6186 family protein [Mycobacteriales bacterium]|jgi:hypothetical protein
MTTARVAEAGFLLLIALGFVLEMLARRPDATVPTVAEVMDRCLRTKTGRVLILVTWWWLGWHFLAR